MRQAIVLLASGRIWRSEGRTAVGMAPVVTGHEPPSPLNLADWLVVATHALAQYARERR